MSDGAMPEDGGKVGMMAVANADASWASRRAAGALCGRSEMDLHGSRVCCLRLVEGRAAATAERLQGGSGGDRRLHALRPYVGRGG